MFVKTESMPTDACVYFYDCAGCGALLRPKAGDCCVFCSYGAIPCPPIQLKGQIAGCCGNEAHNTDPAGDTMNA